MQACHQADPFLSKSVTQIFIESVHLYNDKLSSKPSSLSLLGWKGGLIIFIATHWQGLVAFFRQRIMMMHDHLSGAVAMQGYET
jgi:hypothetical protein